MKFLLSMSLHLMLGIMLCSFSALGMSVVGHQMMADESDASAQRSIGQCRRCANTIRFAPGEWCSMCRVCGQLTNIDQVKSESVEGATVPTRSSADFDRVDLEMAHRH